MPITISGISAVATGGPVQKPGDTVTFTLATSAAVSVAPGSGGALPVLTLNNGAVATYDPSLSGGSPSASLVFTYTVQAGQDQDTAGLRVTGLDPNGATIASPPVYTTAYAAGVSPCSVAVADATGDGLLDIVAANFEGNAVSVLAGDGAGGFGPAVGHATAGRRPISVAVADVTGDGEPDLVTADYWDHTVSVLAGDGAGGFAPAVGHATGTGPYSVAVADVTGDGEPDLVTANLTSDTVSVLAGDGAGGFAPAVHYAAGNAPYSVAVADVTGDGRPDLVTADYMDHAVSVLAGDGAGGFGPAVHYAAGQYPVSVAVADATGDGRLDLVAANLGGHTVSVLAGDGAGGFAPAVHYAAGSSPHAVVVADVTADARPDLVAANLGSGTVSVLAGDGAGGFGPAAAYAVGTFPGSLAVADVTADGRLDLVTADEGSGTVSVVDLTATATPLDASGLAGLAGSDTGLDVDTTAPALAAAGAGAGASGPTNRAEAVVSGTVSDAGAVAKVEVYDLFEGAWTLLGEAALDAAAGTWTYTAAGLADGAHSFWAVATDGAGNGTGLVPAGETTVDTTAPGAPHLAGLRGERSGAGGGAGLVLRGTAEAGSAVRFFIDDAPVAGVAAAGPDGAWALTVPAGLADGAHSLRATATDLAGNASAASPSAPVAVRTVPAGAAVGLDNTCVREVEALRTGGGDVVVTGAGGVEVVRGADELRFVDGRIVFDPEDAASEVARLYHAGFGRDADQAGLDHWMRAAALGVGMDDIALCLLDSAEGRGIHGADPTDAGFVARLHRNALGREGDAEGQAFWADRLGDGASRAQVLAAFADGAESRTAAADPGGLWDLDEGAAQVARLYHAVLGRLPDADGLAFWAGVLNTGRATLQSVAEGFMASPEYGVSHGPLTDAAFVEAVYRSALDRPGDAAGVDHWLVQLDAGLGRAALLAAFSENPEHAALTAADITGSAPRQFGIHLL